jgi:hypothetical protein
VDTSFKPTEKFSIPDYNGSISFGIEGTYTQANLENGMWNFINLRFNTNPQQESLNLKASAHDSNITISLYRAVRSNTSLGSIRLRYTVEGEGKQSFNFGTIPEGGIWNVIFDSVFRGQYDGWNVSDEGTVIIDGAVSNANVTIIYYIYPDFFVQILDQPFYIRHSVAIATGIIIVFTVAIALSIKMKQRRLEQLKQNLLNEVIRKRQAQQNTKEK